MTEDIDIELDILEEGLGFMVAEGLVRDIASELEELHMRQGAHFIWQLKVITNHPSFTPVKDEVESGIISIFVGGCST